MFFMTLLTKNYRKRTMVACLVQQLFRQKVGIELDQGIVDEVLFPILRSRKDLPRELLQDIKLVTDTLIHRCPLQWSDGLRKSKRVNVQPFTSTAEVPWNFRSTSPWPRTRRAGSEYTSSDWGTIDILNELRGREYPQIGYGPTHFFPPPGRAPPDEFDDSYIFLDEDEPLPPKPWTMAERARNHVVIERRKRFMNNFLDDALSTGKSLTWNGVHKLDLERWPNERIAIIAGTRKG
jgi:hypothetical protein